MNLDDTDRAILEVLLEDARTSQRALARKVGIAQGTVSVSYTHLTLPTILLV